MVSIDSVRRRGVFLCVEWIFDWWDFAKTNGKGALYIQESERLFDSSVV
jgi:hypothetical protein